MNKSELSWRRNDYAKAGHEIPERLINDQESCEGELMSEDEIAEYVQDGIKTCLILKDKNSPRFEQVQEAFFADLAFLKSIGRMDEDEYNEIIKEDNYTF